MTNTSTPVFYFLFLLLAYQATVPSEGRSHTPTTHPVRYSNSRPVTAIRHKTPTQTTAQTNVAIPFEMCCNETSPISLASSRLSKEDTATETKKLKNARKTFLFSREDMIREHWLLNAQDDIWSIENNSLKFSAAARQFPLSGLKFRYKLSGAVAVEVLGYMNESSLVTIHLCGERFIAEPRRNAGPLKLQIRRQGKRVHANLNRRITTTMLKESRADLPSGLSITWGVKNTGGGECRIKQVSVWAEEAKEESF